MSKQKLSLTGKLLPLGNNLYEGKSNLCCCLEQRADSVVNGCLWAVPSRPVLGFAILKDLACSLSPKWEMSPYPSVFPRFLQTGTSRGVIAHAQIS